MMIIIILCYILAFAVAVMGTAEAFFSYVLYHKREKDIIARTVLILAVLMAIVQTVGRFI